MSSQKTTHPMDEWVLHLRNLDSRLRGNDEGSATAFSKLMRPMSLLPLNLGSAVGQFIMSFTRRRESNEPSKNDSPNE